MAQEQDDENDIVLCDICAEFICTCRKLPEDRDDAADEPELPEPPE